MLSGVIAFLSSLPQLITLIAGVMGWINKVSSDDRKKIMVETGEVFKKLGEAKTEKDHADAARSIAGIISRLPPR